MGASTPAVVKGLSASGMLFTDRRQFYISPNVVKELWTDLTPFLTITANRGMDTSLKDPLFKQFEHRNPWMKQEMTTTTATTINSSGAESSALTINQIWGLVGAVANGQTVAVDDSLIGLECEIWDQALKTKRGIVVITDAASSTSIKVKHLWPYNVSITTVSGDYIRVIGNVQGAGGTSPDAWSDELSLVYGSTQFMRTPVEIKGDLYWAALRGESKELQRLRIQKSQEHKVQKDRTMLFGGSIMTTGMAGETFADTTRTETASGSSNSLRSTMGIVPAIEYYGNSSDTYEFQNIFQMAEANFNYNKFVDYTEKAFQYPGDNGFKYGLCGRGLISYFAKLEMFKKSDWLISLHKDELRDPLGFNYRVLETPHGIIRLVPTWAFRGPYNKQMLLISDQNLELKQFRPEMYQTNILTNNAPDLVKDEYTSDEGVAITLIESHSLWKVV